MAFRALRRTAAEIDEQDLADRPHLLEMGQSLVHRDADRQFEVGLDLLIAGLAGMVAAAAPPAS